MAEAATAPNDVAELVAFARRAHQAALLSLGHDTGSRERLWVWPAG